MLATLIASINGWIILWGARNWGVCLYSFAWLPWFWWSLERLRAGRGGWLAFAPAGLFLFLIVTAGWPFTIAMAALVTALGHAADLGRSAPPAGAVAVPHGLARGIALSAPAWLMVIEFIPYADRARGGPLLAVSVPGWCPWTALPGLILPNVVARWPIFGITRDHASAELAGGLAPLVILIACLWYGGRGPAPRPPLGADVLRPGLALRSQSVARPVLAQLSLAAVFLPRSGSCRRPRPRLGALPQRPVRPAVAPSKGVNGAASRRPQAAEPRPDRPGPRPGRLGPRVLSPCKYRDPASHVGRDRRAGRLPVVVHRRPFRAGSLARAWAPCGVALLTCWIAYASCRTVTDVPVWHFGDEVRDAKPLDPARPVSERPHLCRTFSTSTWYRVNEHPARHGDELYSATPPPTPASTS